MSEIQAIEKRISNRRYTERRVEETMLQKIKALVDEYNGKSGLSMRVVTDDAKAFEGKQAAMFHNARNYIALIGKKDDADRQEKEGYYGEKIVLALADMGLGTCWAASSFDQNAASISPAEDEVLDLAIAFGYAERKLTMKEQMMRRVLGKNAKSKEELIETGSETPPWLDKAIDAVLKAPTTKNTYPFKISCHDGMVTIRTDGGNERVMVDLGIAKLHFEIGAGGGKWDMGSPAEFHKE